MFVFTNFIACSIMVSGTVDGCTNSSSSNSSRKSNGSSRSNQNNNKKIASSVTKESTDPFPYPAAGEAVSLPPPLPPPASGPVTFPMSSYEQHASGPIYPHQEREFDLVSPAATYGEETQHNNIGKPWRQRSKTKTSAFAEPLDEEGRTDGRIEQEKGEENDEDHQQQHNRSETAGAFPHAAKTTRKEPRDEPHGRRGRDHSCSLEVGLASFLREGPRADPTKKTFLSTILQRSNSERRFRGPRKKMNGVVALKRMSDGREYNHIVVKDFYDVAANTSTYKVNQVDSHRSSLWSKGKKPGAHGRAGKEEEEEGGSGPGTGRKEMPIEEMETDIDYILRDGANDDVDASTAAEVATLQPRDMSPAPMLPLRRAAESTFGVDFSSILKRHEEMATGTVATPSSKRAKRGGSLNVSLMTKSDSRSNVRDVAGETKPKFLAPAFARRSKSPPKAKHLHSEGNQARDVRNRRALEEAPKEEADFSAYRRQINNIRDSVAQHAALRGLVPLTSTTVGSRGQAAATRDSIMSYHHSKTPSGVSIGSAAEDNFSDISSAVISDAQSVALQRPKSAQEANSASGARRPAGPAPTGPLPSLPEGVDLQPPVTPGRSESGQLKPSPERSPVKTSYKTPTKYKLTPTEIYPQARNVSPEQHFAFNDFDKGTKKPAALIRIQSGKIPAFPSPPPSPERGKRSKDSVDLPELASESPDKGSVDDRSERTKKLKARDLAKERSLVARSMHEPKPPVPKLINGGDGRRGSIERLIDAYHDTVVPNPSHRTTSSQTDQIIAGFSHDLLGSVRLSQHEFSPIITVAEQRPYANRGDNGLTEENVASYPHLTSVSDNVADGRISFDRDEASFKCRGSDCFEDQTEENQTRPTYESTPMFLNPASLRSEVHRASPRSSYTDLDLEARMTAMEKRNLLLEQAFLAVVDASASISYHGENSLQLFSSTGKSDEDQLSGSFSGASSKYASANRDSTGSQSKESNDRLCAGLERLLARHGGGRASTYGGDAIKGRFGGTSDAFSQH